MIAEIQNMRSQFVASHRGTSFSPEKRADYDMREFSAELEEDLKTMEGSYKEKYLRHLSKYLAARSRCLSFMITGPANFPTARNKKNNGYADNAWSDFRNWRERYFKAVNRQRTLSPEEEIDKTLAKLDRLKTNQEAMKAINKIVRRKAGTIEEKKSEIMETWGFSEKLANDVFAPDFCGKIGFPSYALTNNNANIKRQEEKLLIMKARIDRKNEWEPIKFEGGYIDIQNDRVVIFHDDKPSLEIRDKLKSRGFRWSRNFGCWCRKHTGNAISAAKDICVIA